MRRYLPIELDVRDRPVAIIGDHPETRKKLPRLLDAGARIDFWDAGAEVGEEVRKQDDLRVCAGMPERLAGYVVVFVAPELAEAFAEQGERSRREGRLFCVLDRPEHSTFANPAVVDAGGIGLRLFGGGAAPGLTRRLREDLERALSSDRMRRFVALLSERRRRWPRSERAARTHRALRGFALQTTLSLPDWFDDTETRGKTAARKGEKS